MGFKPRPETAALMFDVLLQHFKGWYSGLSKRDITGKAVGEWLVVGRSQSVRSWYIDRPQQPHSVD